MVRRWRAQPCRAEQSNQAGEDECHDILHGDRTTVDLGRLKRLFIISQIPGTQAVRKRHDDPESPTRVSLGTEEAVPLSKQMAVLDLLLVGCQGETPARFSQRIHDDQKHAILTIRAHKRSMGGGDRRGESDNWLSE